ncbi:MAG: hypothetical protein Q9183_007480, partial [Haloplaca sp. 2 TL-2023]
AQRHWSTPHMRLERLLIGTLNISHNPTQNLLKLSNGSVTLLGHTHSSYPALVATLMHSLTTLMPYTRSTVKKSTTSLRKPIKN